MNNFLKCCCVLAFSFLLSPGIFAHCETDGVQGIYICTKDIDRPESFVSEKIINNSSYGDEFLPLEGVVESGEKHQIGRHCFMLNAKYQGTIVEPDGTKRLNLVKVDSYAFGKAAGKTATYEETLVGLPKNMAISCTMLMDENDLPEEKINQKLVVIKKEVCSNGVCNNSDSELKQAAILSLMTEKWNAITWKMDLEKLNPYNLGKHNCCTVAYKGAATLFEGDEEKVKEKVDPSTFNIYGTGVVWSNYILASSWILIESSGSAKAESTDASTEIEQEKNQKREL
jgi:hypothetical protein